MDFSDYPPQQGRTGYIVLNAGQCHELDMAMDEYLIVNHCMFCDHPAHTIVPGHGLWAWEHGAAVQDAFPHLSADDRETVLTGTHPACWSEFMDDSEFDQFDF